jgi:photosystem II stability/assembly factor-like uncharacterized protein
MGVTMNAIIKIIIVLILSSSFLFSQQWQQLNSGTNGFFRDLDFISESVGWVVGHSGIILKTTNGGTNWIQQNSNTSSDLYTVYFLDDQNGWVGGFDGILLKTTNGGDNWVVDQLTTDNISGLTFLDQNIGLAVTGKLVPYYYSYILKTTNGGASWQQKYESFYGYDAYLDLFNIGNYGWAVGTGIISRTTNAGENWIDVYSPTDQWLYDVFFFDNTTGWAVGGGTDSEIILKTANGGNSWQIQRESYQYQRLQGVCFMDLQNGWAVGENGVILKTTNGGSIWTEFNSPTNNYLREIQFPSPTVGYIVGENGTILKFSDNSDFIHITDPNGGETITTESNYYILWNSQNVVDVKLEYSTDNGLTWMNIIDSIPSTGIFEWVVPVTLTTQGRMKISDITNPIIFDASDGPFTIQSSKVITVLTPNGAEVINGGSTYEITWNSIDVEYVNIEYSINNGASWTTIIEGTQSTGVYLWEVPNVLTIQGRIKISDHSFPTIYDVSDNSFRINFPVFVDDPNNLTDYRLLQNYPNPFNPSTNIQFNIPEFSFVTLSVYDLLGNLISTLVSDNLTAGNYTVEFGGTDIPSGLYIYKIVTSKFTDAKKMILMK